MKIIIFLLVCCFCTFSNCIPHISKCDVEDTLEVPIEYRNGSTRIITLTRTDGVLANRETPVWYSEGSRDSDDIKHTPHTDLESLGRFDFYQNFDEKAAIVVFHDQNKALGFIDFKRITHSLENLGDLYVRVPKPQLLRLSTPGKGDNVDCAATGEDRPNHERPWTVYPQFLVAMPRLEVKKNLTGTLEVMLAHWNRVDMMYSGLENPRFKFNIAGFIAPMNDYATPWVEKAQVPNDPKIFDSTKGMSLMTEYFKKNSHIFPENKYDYMISITDQMPGGMAGGTNTVWSCKLKASGGSFIEKGYAYWGTIAHEIAHLFGVGHDYEIVECKDHRKFMNWRPNFDWSECSIKAFQKYFSEKQNHECVLNCPSTKPNCHDPVPTESSVIGEIFDYPYSCVHNPVEICQLKNASFAGFQNMKCDYGGLECKLPFKNSYNLTTEGVMCDRTESGKISACVGGQCIAINRNIPECVSTRSRKTTIVSY